MQHEIAMWSAIKLPWTRRLLIWLDDMLKYGERIPIQKWWLDLEIPATERSTKKVVAAAGTNQRDLTLERDVSGANERIAVFPVETLPTADQKEAVPLDRKQGLADTIEAAKRLAELKHGTDATK